MANCARVIALIDMDCFYVQVEERDDPSIKGKSAAVVQYNAWKGGGLIAVNYEARAQGVNRHMRGDDAKEVCPEIILVKVPELRGKADLTKYRAAGQEVIKVLSEFPAIVERASIDEAYLDLTEMIDERLSLGSSSSWDIHSSLKCVEREYLDNCFVLGFESNESWFHDIRSEEMMSISDAKLAVGAEIVGRMRKAIFDRTGFRCSAGIAHNKILAKLVCGMNKPNKQTVCPHSSVNELYAATKLKKVRNLGGKLGDSLVEQFNCDTMADVAKLSEGDLSHAFGEKTGSWLYNLAKGFDDEPVSARQLPKSIGCNKNFMGPETLRNIEKMKHWTQQLSAEVVERLQKDSELNNRKAKSLTMHVRFEDGSQISRTCGVPSYSTERMSLDVSQVMEKIHRKNQLLGITSLGLIASKFEDDLDSSTFQKIDSFFTKMSKCQPSYTITTPDPEFLEVKEDTPLPTEPNAGETVPEAMLQSSLSDLPTIPSPLSKPSLSILKEPISVTELFRQLNEVETSVRTATSKLQHGDDNEMRRETLFKRSETLSRDDCEIMDIGAEVEKGQFCQWDLSHSNSSLILKNINPEIGSEKPGCSKSLSSEPDLKPTKNSPVKSFTKKCDRCGQSIVVWNFPVHMDYHFAKDLQREINGMPPLADNTSKPESKTFAPITLPKRLKPSSKRSMNGKSGTGSKRGRGAQSNPGTAVNMRPIESYFKTLDPPANHGG